MRNCRSLIKMLLRRRLCRRGLCLLLICCAALYSCALLFGDVRTRLLSQLTELHRCPACYGVSICPELYSSQIMVDSRSFLHIFNAKNVFYGTTKGGKRVVLKKLAHDWELREADKKLCAMINKTEGCKANDLLKITNIQERMAQLVGLHASYGRREARAGLVLCPYTHALPQLLQPMLEMRRPSGTALNALTMLLLNPEPILLQLMDSRSWPVPAWGGACGRLSVVAHSGEPLVHFRREPWRRRLHYANQILNAAMDFTFKDERFRFYLMDWSLDNIVVDAQDKITFVDLEDVIVLDKHITPGPELPDWYMRYNRDNYGPGFVFSVEKMCRHHLSDHNLWAACYVLAGDDGPLLLPIPPDENERKPHLGALLRECIDGDNKFKTMSKLQQVVADILNDDRNVVR